MWRFDCIAYYAGDYQYLYKFLSTFPEWYKSLKIMEKVLISQLVSSENQKTTAACNFQTMAMNSSAMPHDLMSDQIGS